MSDKPSKPTNRNLFDWLGYRTNMDWNVAKPLGHIFGSILAIAIPILFFGSILAAGFVLWGTIRDIGSGASAGPNLGAGAMIAALLGAPFIIWGTYLRQRAVEFQKEGLLTERINKAVEMLGAEKTVKRQLINSAGKKVFRKSENGKPDYAQPVLVDETLPNIEVRIGGLLSLERIAQDSVRYDEGRDHVRVMEILCAYVRENAPASEAIDFPLPEWEPFRDGATEDEKAQHIAWRKVRFEQHWNSNAREWAKSLNGPREDIALAVRIIGRREADQRAIEATWGPDARESETWVFETPCPVLAEPAEGGIHAAEKIGAYKTALDEWKSVLNNYSGYRPDLRNTNLQRADLSGLVLSGCRLENARMEGANLYMARMEGANLGGARMEGITSLNDVVFHQASFKDVNLGHIPISQDQVNESFGDASVTLPDGITAPRHWPEWILPWFFDDDAFYDQWRIWRKDPANYTPPPKPEEDPEA